ncbi:MAG: PEP-CTERM sorting domain-containing protein [Chloroflexi bacterium]|nr:PEP-CTERM sorting domain-containing protein [Chloroflexota bacterium]
MKQMLRLLIALLMCACLSVPVLALELGSDITIYDKNSTTETGWYSAQEDDEVEPGMAASQAWDLEGFFLDQNSLSMVGGFNFQAGVGGYTSGDIFISVEDEPVYGDIHLAGNDVVWSNDNGNAVVSNTYGYGYVLDLDFEKNTYTVYGIDEKTTLLKAFYQLNEGSSPWRYDATINDETPYTSGDFSFFTSPLVSDLSDAATGFNGGSRYALTGFDLSFLGHGTEFYAHFTMGCGNDNLMGQGTVVPEPSTFLLFGAGGGLLWLARRKTARKN